MATKDFEKAWAELSQTQVEAASWVSSPLLVIAGPGSGKTRVLTCRIARLLESSKGEKSRILGLTFTTKAADEMRQRVLSFVPDEAHRLFLGTFHSFCTDVLSQHGQHVGVNPSFKVYAEIRDHEAILVEALREVAPDLTGDRNMVSQILKGIRYLQNQLTMPQNAQETLGHLPDSNLVSLAYEAYVKALLDHRALDFETMIVKTHELLTRYPVFARRYQDVFPQVCVDEFQDTTFAQYQLLKALVPRDRAGVFVVADDDQIIYQWNGADVRRLEEFSSDFCAKVIQLPVNYRCPAEVVDVANHLIENNFRRSAGRVPIRSVRSPASTNPITLLGGFDGFEDECRDVVARVKDLHSTHLERVAVIARSRSLLEGVQQAAGEVGLPTVVLQRKNDFESTPLSWLHAMLSLANDHRDREAFTEIVGTLPGLLDAQIDSETHVRLEADQSKDYFHRVTDLVRKLGSPSNRLLEVATPYTRLSPGSEVRYFLNAALDWLDAIAIPGDRSGSDQQVGTFADYIDERKGLLHVRDEILRAFGPDISLQRFLSELDIRSKEAPPEKGVLPLMTIHGSKGKEFDHVYLVGLVEGELPSYQSIRAGDNGPEMEEERRSCYVAVTRTLDTLTCSYAEKYRGWQRAPSRFLYEMGLLSQ